MGWTIVFYSLIYFVLYINAFEKSIKYPGRYKSMKIGTLISSLKIHHGYDYIMSYPIESESNKKFDLCKCNNFLLLIKS